MKSFHVPAAVVFAAFALLVGGCGSLPPSEKKAVKELRGTGLPHAEKLLARSDRFQASSSARAVYRLRAAEIAWNSLENGPRTQKEQAAATAVLNEATERLAPTLLRDGDGDRVYAFGGHAYQLGESKAPDISRAKAVRTGQISADSLIRAKSADRVPSVLCKRRIIQQGMGAPLVADWKAPTKNDEARFYPENGYIAPVTATLKFTKADSAKVVPPGVAPDRAAEITFLDPTIRSTTEVSGTTYPLAADFTAPIVDHNLDVRELVQALLGLVHPDRFDARLSLTEPYDPNRIPVVLVHGLVSHPRMWRDVINELRADPELRGRFQFWTFYYPTGWPISYSSLRLREEMAARAKTYGLRKDVLLMGHSMGGLLSRMQVSEPGDVIWNKMLGENADDLKKLLPEEHLLRRMFLFHASPEVSRVIFVAVPHRGSELALWSLPQWLSRLIKLPSTITSLVIDVPGMILQRGQFTGINTLSPKSKILQSLEQIPITVPHHSIVGDLGWGGVLKQTDGVVPYRSSHLDSAESELMVRYHHSAYECPEAITEMKRILKEHLAKETKRATSSSGKGQRTVSAEKRKQAPAR